MKSKTVAFVLSALVAGSGLAYLGLWKQAAINFALAVGLGVTLGLILPEHVFDFIDTGLAAGVGGVSGAYAMEMAEKLNKDSNETPTLEELSDEARLP